MINKKKKVASKKNVEQVSTNFVLKIYGDKLTRKVLAKVMKDMLDGSSVRSNKTVSELINNGKDFKKIPITDTDIDGFRIIAVDFQMEYTILRNQRTNEWQIYFKAKKKADLINAFKEYINKVAEAENNPKQPLFGPGSQMEWAQKMADEHNNKNKDYKASSGNHRSER